MSDFTKTLIVDADGNGDYKYINQAAWQFDPNNPSQIADGGTIIVEQETYTIDEEDDYSTTNTNMSTTVYVPSKRNTLYGTQCKICGFVKINLCKYNHLFDV